MLYNFFFIQPNCYNLLCTWNLRFLVSASRKSSDLGSWLGSWSFTHVKHMLEIKRSKVLALLRKLSRDRRVKWLFDWQEVTNGATVEGEETVKRFVLVFPVDWALILRDTCLCWQDLKGKPSILGAMFTSLIHKEVGQVEISKISNLRAVAWHR